MSSLKKALSAAFIVILLSANGFASHITNSFNPNNFTLELIKALPEIWPYEFNYMAKRTEYKGLQNPELHIALYEKVKGDFFPEDALWAIIFCKDDNTCYKILERTKGQFSWDLYNFYKLTQHRPGLKRLREMVAEMTYFIHYEDGYLYEFLNADEFPLAWKLVGKHCDIQYACYSTEGFKRILRDSNLYCDEQEKIAKKYDNIRIWVLGQWYPKTKKARKMIINGEATEKICPAGKDYCPYCGYIESPDTFHDRPSCPSCKKSLFPRISLE
ncbi:MAG: hypothetical protein V1860_03555 [bacterium]